MRYCKRIIINEVVATASPGSDVLDCIREALILGLEEDVHVAMIHNEHRYLISTNAILRDIYNQKANHA